MAKNFILDTNVLLHDPRALFSFGDNNVVIPIYVIEEVDNFKRDLTELGRNARQVSRYLDELREKGQLAEGVPLDNGGTLRVAFTDRKIPAEFANTHEMDNRILSVALDTRDRNPEVPTTFVTMDSNLRIRADALGVEAENFENEPVHQISELYSGMQELTVEPGAIDRFYRDSVIDAPGEIEMRPNEHAVLIDSANPSHTALAKYRGADQTLLPLIRVPKEGIWGIRPRNKEQAFALDVLLNDEISLVTMVGKAGTGKTLLAIAAALQKVMEEGVYHKLLVSRPIFPMGRDIGYLPGDVEEKLNPWMQPIYDNVEFLMGLSRADKKAGRSYQELVDLGIMSIEPLTYIRGRSIPQQYIIVDEAQNLTPHEVKTIITRAGDNTKIVLTGDPYQIDNPYVDSTSNGLVHVVHRFMNEPIAGHVTLTKGERSKLAEAAANLL
ncbi:MAG: PhoH family protein [Deltaproteobacteria bacterium]|nr:PhoH family protein [Deltaproteobacteria bacterium]